jgi:RHS repeat-associated protein
MAGISDKALKTNYAENKYRYNGGNELQNQEFSDGSGLELYESTYRLYDPQLGRFGQVDPLAFLTSEWSSYAFALNNPILRNDPTGLKDSIPVLAPAVVTAKLPLKGGEYNGQNFDNIKETGDLFFNLHKKLITPNTAVDDLKKEIESTKKAEELLKTIGELGGGSVGLKSIKELKEILQKLLTGKLTISPATLLAAQVYLEGMKTGALAEDLQKVVDTYIGIHSSANNPNPSPANGIYVITTNLSVQNAGFGLSNVITTSSYYDVSTKQFLGEITTH